MGEARARMSSGAGVTNFTYNNCMTDLLNKKCIPCESGNGHLMASDIKEMLKQIPGWEFEGFHHIAKTFRFRNFKEALDFTDKVGALAESEGHHPDIELSWGRVNPHTNFTELKNELENSNTHKPTYNRKNDFVKIGVGVKIKLFTHSVSGLSENDFILAAKIDAIK